MVHFLWAQSVTRLPSSPFPGFLGTAVALSSLSPWAPVSPECLKYISSPASVLDPLSFPSLHTHLSLSPTPTGCLHLYRLTCGNSCLTHLPLSPASFPICSLSTLKVGYILFSELILPLVCTEVRPNFPPKYPLGRCSCLGEVSLCVLGIPQNPTEALKIALLRFSPSGL